MKIEGKNRNREEMTAVLLCAHRPVNYYLQYAGRPGNVLVNLANYYVVGPEFKSPAIHRLFY